MTLTKYETLACQNHLFHVLIEDVEDVHFFSFLPVTFYMIIPRAPAHYNNIGTQKHSKLRFLVNDPISHTCSNTIEPCIKHMGKI